MQLRSGKLIRSTDCENVTIVEEKGTHLSEKSATKSIRSNNNYTNRDCYTEVDHVDCSDVAITFRRNYAYAKLRKWLVTYIRKVLVELGEYNENSLYQQDDLKTRILNRTRLLAELTEVIYSHIDILVYFADLQNMRKLLHSQMAVWGSQISKELLNENASYSKFERNYLGNVRADMVKTAVMVKNTMNAL